MKIIDQEFYDSLSDFVDEQIKSVPTSNEAAINAMEAKAAALRKELNAAPPPRT